MEEGTRRRTKDLGELGSAPSLDQPSSRGRVQRRALARVWGRAPRGSYVGLVVEYNCITKLANEGVALVGLTNVV